MEWKTSISLWIYNWIKRPLINVWAWVVCCRRGIKFIPAKPITQKDIKWAVENWPREEERIEEAKGLLVGRSRTTATHGSSPRNLHETTERHRN